MTRLVTSCALLVLGCSSSSTQGEPKEPRPEAAPERTLSKTEQCLEDAQALRDPDPAAPTTIHVSHILVRHRELKQPSGSKRSREEACMRALEALQALEAGEDWDQVVKRYSDASNDALGRVRQEDLATDFANAAFALDVNEISYVVETSRGFHIILRKN